ncbi:hypothetical protein M0802_012633 [Mischocyttarus mexicanus]|nr:hypothetical protein M0802_012633 [Mischocyttarus mexicanus]
MRKGVGSRQKREEFEAKVGKFKIEKELFEIERNKLLEKIWELQGQIIEMTRNPPYPTVEVPTTVPRPFAIPPTSQPRPQVNNSPFDPIQENLFSLREILEQIPLFDGNNSFVHSFTRACRTAAARLNRLSERDIIECLWQRITVRAHELFIDVDFHTIEEFLKSIKGTFAGNKTLNQYIGVLGHLTQHPNEDIMQYACRTRRLETVLLDAMRNEPP